MAVIELSGIHYVEDVMLGEHAIPVYLIAGAAVALAVGSTFTPVISRGGAVAPSAFEMANAVQEFSFCQSSLENVNCRCFSEISGHILSQDSPDFRGTVSMDKSQLARTQASQSC